MGSLEAEEALLKKKLEATDILEERREIRKQLRELRNRKFEEEVKKVTAGDYRPGKDRSALTNGGEVSLGSIGRSLSVKEDDGEDTYGLNSIENEDDLQAMLNETPFTETDKRKKIRARLREIRNQKLGIGEPVVIKRHHQHDVTASVKAPEPRKETNDKEASSDLNSRKDTEEPRNSYRSKYGDHSESKIEIKSESEPSGRSTRKLRHEESRETKHEESRETKHEESRETKHEESRETKHEESRETKHKESRETKHGRVNGYLDAIVNDDKPVEEVISKKEENGKEEEEVEEEEVEEEEKDQAEQEDQTEQNEFSLKSENLANVQNGAEDEQVLEDDDAGSVEDEAEEDEIDEEEEDEIEGEEIEDEQELNNKKLSGKKENYDDEDVDEGVHAEKKYEDKRNEEEDVEDDYNEDEDQRYSDEEESDENHQVNNNEVEEIENVENKRDEEDCDDDYAEEDALDDKVASSCDDDNVDEEEDEPSQQHRSEEDSQEHEGKYKDESEEEYSQSEGEDDNEVKQSPDRPEKQKYSDDYSESYSDYTATDEGSSVGVGRFEEDQNLDDYENEKKHHNYSPKSPSGSLHRQQGPSYAAKIDHVFKEKEPGIQEGKDFKEKLKKTDKAFQVGGKKGVEQVDFRTLLRSSEKPKRPGDKSAPGTEQVDFRNLLQTKVKTKTLADKGLIAEQVDFRTVLKAGAVEKKQSVPRKTSTAEQIDFRTVLKKEPSVKSRKVSTDDKEIFRKIRAGSDLVAKASPSSKGNERKVSGSSSRSGRPSIDALKRSGSVDKAKEGLNKQRAESTGSESETTTRKASRPSLDALKDSGDLGRTKDKTAVFQNDDVTVFKKPVAPPPKPKKIAKEVIEEVKEDALLLEENQEPKEKQEGGAAERQSQQKEENKESVDLVVKSKSASEKEARSSRRQRRVVREEEEDKPEQGQATEMHEDEAESKTRSRRSRDRDDRPRSRRSVNNEESTEKPRSRRVIRGEESTKTESAKVEQVEEASKPTTAVRRSEEGDDKRSSLKSEDKRARNRRLRRDQNEVVKEVVKEEAKNVIAPLKDSEVENGHEEKVSSIKSERNVVQVKSSANRQSEKSRKSKEVEQEDSDEEEIGTRRNRRRLARKGSTDEQQPIRTSVKSERRKESLNDTEATKAVEPPRESNARTTAETADLDDTDAKPARASLRKHSASSKDEAKSTEKKSPGDAPKSRQSRMADLDAKLAERRRQRAIDNKKKHEQTKSSRMAFKEKLESSAPTTERSQSPALQRANSNMTKLLHWCQRMTDGYPNVEVTNFNKSWSDGLAFCALLHNFVPEKVPFHELSPDRPRENFEIAFSAATEEGVAELLDVDDMVNMKVPDTKSVITYLHSIYQILVSERR